MALGGSVTVPFTAELDAWPYAGVLIVTTRSAANAAVAHPHKKAENCAIRSLFFVILPDSVPAESRTSGSDFAGTHRLRLQCVRKRRR